ncbi:GNAT family N-acetyltransferase [Nocardioides zeae]|uniref:GNAT family N-acetyltransferase n=1 Tax=Nocardioides zeae TaxID=1457234 RepID=UPI0027D773A2|nr:GNAT family N-acetyltransferase [Nocardioides zeae]
MPVTLTTPRLRLRALTVKDAARLVHLHAEAHVQAWLGTFDLTAASARLERFEQQWAEFGYGMFAVESVDRQFMGRCGFVHWPEMGDSGETEIGWALGSAWVGRGFATEAARACLSWFWARDRTVEKVTAMIAPGNQASVAVAESVGLRHERSDVFRGNPIEVYSVTRKSSFAR